MSKPLTMGISYWAKADEAFDRGQQAYLDWCRELAVLYTNGNTTQEAIADRYQKPQPRIAEAIAVGSDERIIRLTYNDIPRDKYGVYLLTTLDDDGFEELCKPTTTQADLRAYKNRLAAPKEAPPPQRPPCPGAEGHGPGCWHWSEAL